MHPTGTVRDHVRSLVIDAAPIEVGRPEPTTRLTDDLGYDSLGLLELANLLENAFDLPAVPEGSLAEITTVGEVEDLVLRMLDELSGRRAG